MTFPEASHPIWSIISSSIRLVVLMTALTAVLWLTASKFDSTEVRTISVVFVTAACGEAVIGYLKNTLAKPKE